jgi:hypothetical protein
MRDRKEPYPDITKPSEKFPPVLHIYEGRQKFEKRRLPIFMPVIESA